MCLRSLDFGFIGNTVVIWLAVRGVEYIKSIIHLILEHTLEMKVSCCSESIAHAEDSWMRFESFFFLHPEQFLPESAYKAKNRNWSDFQLLILEIYFTTENNFTDNLNWLSCDGENHLYNLNSQWYGCFEKSTNFAVSHKKMNEFPLDMFKLARISIRKRTS